MTNQELVEKATITTHQLAAAGKLNPQQADKFIDYVVDESMLKQAARTVRFTPETLDIDKIGVGKRAAVPAAEGIDPGVRRGVNTSKISLTPKEIMVPFELGDTFREINIEGEQVEDHVIKMMATQMANDMEEMYINGDLLGQAATPADLDEGEETDKYIKDRLLALFNGWLRIADGGHIVDNAGAAIDHTLFSKMFIAMPRKFRRNRAQLRFLMPSDLEQIYRDTIAKRETAGGDVALTSSGKLMAFGIEVVPVPLMPGNPTIVEHVQLSGTTAVSLRYKNIIAGSEVVTPSDLNRTPTTPYVGGGTDYTLDEVNGTIVRVALGAIGDGQIVKVTYEVQSQLILTHYNNFIVGIGRDIRIERDRNIYRRVNEFAITAKVSVNFEEVDAIVKAIDVESTL